MTDIKCKICECMFSLDKEGGVSQDFGTIPVNFCPTCLSCVYEMCRFKIKINVVFSKL